MIPEKQKGQNAPAPPVVLTIAGSDNSGGAGLQADLKTFTVMEVYGTSAVTCVVAEHPGRVHRIVAMSPEHVADQIRLVFEAFPVAALKTGMLYSREIIEAAAAMLEVLLPAGRWPLVVDPVMVASSGATLFREEAVEAMSRLLFPRAALVTPNLDEAALLLGRAITNADELGVAGDELAQRWQTPFLVKGGHLRDDLATDILCRPGQSRQSFSAPMEPGKNPHGTGCTYSAAITAQLARGASLPGAVRISKGFLSEHAIGRSFRIGGYDLLNQLPAPF